MSILAYTPVLVLNGKQYHIVLINHNLFIFLLLYLLHSVKYYCQSLFYFFIRYTRGLKSLSFDCQLDNQVAPDLFVLVPESIKDIIKSKYLHKMDFLYCVFNGVEGPLCISRFI